MKAALVVVVALAVAISLASAAAAGPAAKQRVAITVRFHESTYVLTPLQAGALKRDTGTLSERGTSGTCTDVIRDGQKASICPAAWMLTGKRGTLAIQARQEWVESANAPCGVGFGTWKVIRGTGQYAGIAGGGRSAYEAHCQKWYARHEGSLTTR